MICLEMASSVISHCGSGLLSHDSCKSFYSLSSFFSQREVVRDHKCIPQVGFTSSLPLGSLGETKKGGRVWVEVTLSVTVTLSTHYLAFEIIPMAKWINELSLDDYIYKKKSLCKQRKGKMSAVCDHKKVNPYL